MSNKTSRCLLILFFITILSIGPAVYLFFLEKRIETFKTKSIDTEERIRKLENTVARLVSKKVILYPTDEKANTRFADEIIKILDDINDLFLSEEKLEKNQPTKDLNAKSNSTMPELQ